MATETRSMDVIEPDDDHDNPVGEVLDDDTIAGLRGSLTSSLVDVLVRVGVAGVGAGWYAASTLRKLLP